MEKIKAALHIHDKTPAPGDGAVGNMQNPSSSDQQGPTAADLWGSGNADMMHHNKGDTVAAAAAAENVRGSSKPPAAYKTSPLGATHAGQNSAAGTGSGSAQGLGPINENPNAILQNPVTHGEDDPFGHGQRAQAKMPATQATHGALPEGPTASAIPEEKIGSSSAKEWTQLDPLNQPEPAVETGPGTHFRPGTASTDASAVGMGSASQPGEHTAYHDMATGRGPHDAR